MQQRFTALGNLVLVNFLLISFLLLPDLSYLTVREWLSGFPAVALAWLIVSVFWHARLGMQVMIEDYVDAPGNKFGAVAALNLITVGGAVFALFCIARLAFGGAA